MTMSEVKARMEEGRKRLAEHGIYVRDVRKRLEWKESRGIDTTVERRILGLKPSGVPRRGRGGCNRNDPGIGAVT